MKEPNWTRLERDRQRHDDKLFNQGEPMERTDDTNDTPEPEDDKPFSPGHIICNDEWTVNSQFRQMAGRFAGGPFLSADALPNDGDPRYVTRWKDRHGRTFRDVFALSPEKQVYHLSRTNLDDDHKAFADNWRDLVENTYYPGAAPMAEPDFYRYLQAITCADPRSPCRDIQVNRSSWRHALCNLCCGFDSRARDVMRAFAETARVNLLQSGWASSPEREAMLDSLSATLETSIQCFSFTP